MDYKNKYLKYKKKYLALKGGNITIAYDSYLLEDPILSKMKESIYSYCYLLRTSIEDDQSKICPKDYPNINCNLIDTIEFEVNGISGSATCNIKILKDNIHNNIILCFKHGSVLFIPTFDNELLNKLKEIYEKLQILTDYDKIIITGHSMGASVARLFTYMIMVIESSTIDDIKIEDRYCTIVEEDMSIPIFKYDDEEYYEEEKKSHETRFNRAIKKNLDSKLIKINTIKCNLKEIIEKNYPKIHPKIDICVAGGFPVLFRKNDYDEFKKYVNFYDNRYLHFISTQENDEGNLTYDPVTLNYCYNHGIFSKLELSNFEVYNIYDLNKINLNDLPPFFKHTEEPDNMYNLKFTYSNHFYYNYIPILKRFITINVIAN
jgi:hypothetical protein